MCRVLITSIGANPAIDVARSLRLDPTLRLTGADAGSWGRKVGARLCHEVIELPRADQPEAFVEALERAAQTVDFVFLGLDVEIEAVAAVGRELKVPCAFPRVDVLRTILDKSATEGVARDTGHFPGTVAVDGSVQDIFDQLGSPIWMRPSIGTSAQAATRVDTPEKAEAWLTYWGFDRSRWMAQSFLPGRNLNVSLLFSDGELRAWASMERLGYLLSNVAPSGVTGQVRLCATLDEEAPRAISEEVVRAVDDQPHGLYSVDLREDALGVPKVTEINPRLAGRPWLYTNAGRNLPLAAVRVLRGSSAGDAIKNGGQKSMAQYRLVDMDPLFEEGR